MEFERPSTWPAVRTVITPCMHWVLWVVGFGLNGWWFAMVGGSWSQWFEYFLEWFWLVIHGVLVQVHKDNVIHSFIHSLIHYL